jgi:hypothetical protein
LICISGGSLFGSPGKKRLLGAIRASRCRSLYRPPFQQMSTGRLTEINQRPVLVK